MNWEFTVLTLRCSNDSAFTTYHDVSIDCVGAPPSHTKLESGEIEPSGDDILTNNVARRRSWKLIARDLTVGESNFDHGHYENIIPYLSAEHIRIESVIGSERVLRTIVLGEEVVVPYWENVGLPIEVSVDYEEPEYKPEIGGFGWSLTLNEIAPIIGVSIT